jgi:hypothetical protein
MLSPLLLIIKQLHKVVLLRFLLHPLRLLICLVPYALEVLDLLLIASLLLVHVPLDPPVVARRHPQLLQTVLLQASVGICQSEHGLVHVAHEHRTLVVHNAHEEFEAEGLVSAQGRDEVLDNLVVVEDALH